MVPAGQSIFKTSLKQHQFSPNLKPIPLSLKWSKQTQYSTPNRLPSGTRSFHFMKEWDMLTPKPCALQSLVTPQHEPIVTYPQLR